VVNRAFLEDRCRFLQMAEVIAQTMQRTAFIEKPTYEDYVNTDKEARQIARDVLESSSEK